jgi:Mrp family chromosome partitioning ATPase
MNTSAATHLDFLPEISEMKRIYSVIENSLLKNNSLCLVVTSGLPDEGKTTIATGLAAIAAGQRNLRVLAVDFNWYKPALHKWFGLVQSFDASALDRGKSILDSVQSTHLKNLDILTASSASHNDINWDQDVNRPARNIINQAREAYDIVIIDSSSIFPVNRNMMDPVAISMDVDGVVLVALANVTPRQKIKRARMLLETAGAHVIGVVVNQWKNPLF